MQQLSDDGRQTQLAGQPVNGGVLHFYPDTAKGNNNRVDCLSPVRAGKYNLLTQAVKDARNIRVLSVATLIGEAIGRTATEESVSSLFD